MTELKPCPFCGAPGAPYRAGEGEYIYAGCDKECHGFPELIDKWNTRPIEDALRAENARLAAELAALKAANAWHPAREILPEHKKVVWACGKLTGYCGEAYYDAEMEQWYWNEYYTSGANVSMWRELPAPPEVENGTQTN